MPRTLRVMFFRFSIFGLVAVAGLAACSPATGSGDATPNITNTTRSASDRITDDCIVDAMIGFDLALGEETGDSLATSYLTKVAQKYGTHSRNMDVIVWAYTRTAPVWRQEIPKEQVYDGIKSRCRDGVSSTIESRAAATQVSPSTANPSGGWPNHQATILPKPDSAPKDDLITCQDVIYYYAPLLAKDPNNVAIIMRNSYGGSAYGQLERQMTNAAADPRLAADAKAVAQDACGS